MRKIRRSLLREARCEAKDALQDNSGERKDNKTKEYYTRNLAACAIFAFVVFMVRAVIGPAPYRILFAITDFANCFGFIHSVYVSIGIFFIMLVFTVFIAQAGVVSGREKRSEGRQQQHDQRMEAAIKRPRGFAQRTPEMSMCSVPLRRSDITSNEVVIFTYGDTITNEQADIITRADIAKIFVNHL